MPFENLNVYKHVSNSVTTHQMNILSVHSIDLVMKYATLVIGLCMTITVYAFYIQHSQFCTSKHSIHVSMK